MDIKDLVVGTRVEIQFGDRWISYERFESVHETYGGRTDLGAQYWRTACTEAVAALSGRDMQEYATQGRLRLASADTKEI